MNTTIIIVMFAAILFAMGTFFGFIGGIPKTFKNQPTSSLDGEKIQKNQRTSAEDTQEKHRQLIEDMKQRISDGKRY